MAVRLGLGASMIEGVTEYRPRFHELVLPLFVMHGTADRLVPITASETVYRDAAGTDKTLEVWFFFQLISFSFLDFSGQFS